MEFLNEDEIMGEERQELIRYGLEILILKVIFVLSVIFLGLIMGCIWECMIFLILFIPIRSMAGGYHAKTRVRCFVLSVFMVVLTMFMLRFTTENSDISLIIFVLSIIFSMVIWFRAPIEHGNKMLSDEEKNFIKRKARVNICIESIVAGLMFYLGYSIVTYLMFISIVIAGILFIIEYIRNKLIFCKKGRGGL